MWWKTPSMSKQLRGPSPRWALAMRALDSLSRFGFGSAALVSSAAALVLSAISACMRSPPGDFRRLPFLAAAAAAMPMARAAVLFHSLSCAQHHKLGTALLPG